MRDGDTTPSYADGTNFGSVSQNAAAPTQIFTVYNTGTGTLTLGTPSLPDGYTLVEGLDGAIAAGDSDSFTVELSTATAGTFAGQISFSTNVSGKNPFNYKITGNVVAVPAIVVKGSGVIIATATRRPAAPMARILVSHRGTQRRRLGLSPSITRERWR